MNYVALSLDGQFSKYMDEEITLPDNTVYTQKISSSGCWSPMLIVSAFYHIQFYRASLQGHNDLWIKMARKRQKLRK